MALQFVLGRSGAGKSYQLYKKIIEQSMAHPEKKYFVIVPEQFTMQTQKDLVNMHPNHGISNIDVLSFLRLAYRVFEEQGGMHRDVLEDTGKSMLVRRVISEKAEELKVFRNFAKKVGYISEIKSLLSEFYQYDVKADTVEKMIDISKDSPELCRKLEDMQVILEGFEEQLEEKYITAEEILDVMVEYLERTQVFQNATLALDGFTGFTPVQYKLLRRLLHLCENVLVTVTIDPKEPEKYQQEEFSLFHLSRETIDKLTKIAKEEGVPVAKDFAMGEPRECRFKESRYLASLEENLYRFSSKPYEPSDENETEDIAFFAGKHMQSEVDYVVREIHHLLKEGYRYRDIAIVTGDMEGYSRLFDKTFGLEQIPCFIDYKKKILENPLVELIRTLLQLFVRNFDYESVFRYLRSGFVDMEAEHVDKMENYVLAMGIKGGNRYKKPWVSVGRLGLHTEEEKETFRAEINEYREEFYSSIEPLAKVFNKKNSTVEAFTIALHDYLVTHGIYYKCKAYEQQFEEEGKRLLAKEYSQVYELVLGIFDKMVTLLGNENLSITEYNDLLEIGFQEVKVGLIPPGIDQVVVGDIERTRLNGIKALFFVGVNEGIVPKSGGKGGILSDMEREKLSEQDVVLAPTARQTVFTQQFYFYLNLTKPSNRLYMTYHKTNSEGKQALPSGLLRTVQKLFPTIKVQEERKISLEQALDEKEMEQVLGNLSGKEFLIAGMRDSMEVPLADWWKELYRNFSKQSKWEEKLDLLQKGVAFCNMEHPLSKQVAKLLYGNEIHNSVTRVEKYASCAFAHFLQYGLKLQKRQEYSFQAMDFGNVFHEVLSMLPRAFEEKNCTWKTASKEEISDTVSTCLTKVVENYGDEVLKSNHENAYLVERMERMLNRTAWALSLQLQQGQFDPVHFEHSFNGDDALKSGRFDLGDSGMVKLIGTIDRVDKLEEPEQVSIKIIDYKTGKTGLDLDKLYHGLQMQLVVYRNAAVEMQQKMHKDAEVETAGIFYYNIDDPIVFRPKNEEEIDMALLKELQMKGLVNENPHMVAMIDKVFGDGVTLSPSQKSWVIPVATNKEGGFMKYSKVASSEKFDLLGEYATYKIAKECKEMLEGNIDISPSLFNKEKACEYCIYKSVCGFDPKFTENNYRKLGKSEDVWNAMKEAMGNGEGKGTQDLTEGEERTDLAREKMADREGTEHLAKDINAQEMGGKIDE